MSVAARNLAAILVCNNVEKRVLICICPCVLDVLHVPVTIIMYIVGSMLRMREAQACASYACHENPNETAAPPVMTQRAPTKRGETFPHKHGNS